MADTLVPHTPPKKLFKPATKTKTPTRAKPSPQSQQQQQTGSPQRTHKDTPRPVPSQESTLDNVAKSTKLAPLTNVPAASDKASDHGGSDTTGETPAGLVDNYVLTPTDDTVSRSTDARSPVSGEASRNMNRVPSFKDKIARAKESAKDSVNGLANTLTGQSADASEPTESSSQFETNNPTHGFKSPIDIAKYFKDQGNPEMSSFVTSLMGDHSSESSENTLRAIKSPAGEEQSSNNRANDTAGDQKNPADSDQAPSSDKLEAEPASVSKTADGTFRDIERDTPAAQPTNKMGEPNVANISKGAHPDVLGANPGNKASSQRPQVNGDGRDKNSHVVDNMGRPAHVERRIEIPLQRQSKDGSGLKQAEAKNSNAASNDLGDFEDLPSTDDLLDIPDEDSPDPPEEILDPSKHTTEATSITPIPKIPKIPHIDSLPPFNLQRLAEGLTGHEIDDVGNIVDESGEVLGHATGDLPAMVGKKVSENGEVYGDDGEIVGYVSDNFINPPSPTEIPGDFIGGLRVDHKGNILDTDGNIIGRFNKPLGNNGSSPKPSPKNDSEGKPKEEQKPKVNAQNGGSPSDLFLDVKSTTDGIQLTIRIPTTFSRPSPES